VLSVGATPTAHAAVLGADGRAHALQGTLELHAGCYCLNDLQQLSTGLVEAPRSAALTVLATVVSTYAHRQEAMCDAGALAVSKDTGPIPGHGRVVSHAGWALGRISQEHGTLTRTADDAEEIRIGDTVRIIPQHACLACACYPWMYVVDGGDEVVDVWVPWKGW
jgi:D-serine deaminase-like pyridoxal phosphate-dependent protein